MLYGGVTLPGKPDMDNIRRIDIGVIPTLNRMSRIGIEIDIPHLRELSHEFGVACAELKKEITSYIPVWALDRFVSDAAGIEEENGSSTFNPSSSEQIGELLFDLLKIGGGMKLKFTAGGKISTGKKNIDLIRDKHPVVPKIQQYREYSKLKSSFADSLPDKAKLHPAGKFCPICELDHVESTHRLHTTFTTTRAITGRLSSKSPNLQQIPIRSKMGSKIRQAFVASRGRRDRRLVSVDFSQMEIRDLAHLANAQSMIRIYNADGDIHQNTAMKCFGITDPAKVDKYLHRLPAKRTNFGVQNGTTGKGLLAQLTGDYWASGVTPPDWLTETWCDGFIVSWHSEYNEVQPYFDTQYYRARRYGFVWNPFGRCRYIPQIQSSLPYKRSEGMREAQNFSVTSSNAEQTKLAMAECEDVFSTFRSSGYYCEALLSIHDQVIAECDEEIADLVGSEMLRIFEEVMNDRETGESLWRCVIKGDCEILERWKSKD